MDSSLRIAYSGQNGSVHIIIPSPQYEGTLEDFVQAHECLREVDWFLLDASELPIFYESDYASRQKPYRNAWRINGGKIVHDMSAAKELHLNNIRRLRAIELERLDKEYARMIASGQSVEAALDQREALLTCTEKVKSTSYADPKALYSEWPSVLEKRSK